MFLIIGAAALALLLIGIIAVVALTGRDAPTTTTDPQTSQPPGSSASAPASNPPSAPAATQASDAVRGYLEALSKGDSASALALMADAPADTSLMSDAVLAESNKLAPLTDINVPDTTDEFAYRVDASYKLGDSPVNESFNVKKNGGHLLGQPGLPGGGPEVCSGEDLVDEGQRG